MKSTLIVISLAGWLLVGCTGKLKEENSQLTYRLDSLQQELDAKQYSMGLLEQVGVYLDSIDANRKWVKVNLETGLAEDDYVERMKVLNQYVQKAEWTIGELEKTRSAYASQVKRLKARIAEKDEEIRILQMTVAEYQSKNLELNDSLVISKQELLNAQLALSSTKDELTRKEAEVESLLQNIKLTQAESFYAQGENKEEIAKRTQLAPKRKNKALEEALEFYQSAMDLGYEPAIAKVDALKKRLKKK